MSLETIVESRTCSVCQGQFDIYIGDLRFYDMFEVPKPKLCFECRLQRRMGFYNRRNLYHRTCAATGKPIVSIYSPDKPYTVYAKDAWYADNWEPTDFGLEIDFTRPFFEQFMDLFRHVPLLPVAAIEPMQNSDYTSDTSSLKNCYLAFDGSESEGVFYAETFTRCRDTLDALDVSNSELCYECVSCQNCYNVKYSRFCNNCFDSWFLRDCVGCKHCFGCANLRQKEYHIFNKRVSKAEFRAFIEKQYSRPNAVATMRSMAEDFFQTQAVRSMRGVQNQDSSGHLLSNCKNSFYCFSSNNLEDCRYCTDLQTGGRDCMDVHVWGNKAERCYNSAVIGDDAQYVMGSCFIGAGSSNVYYSFLCLHNCHDLFGCIGLQHKRNCILNTQYTAEEYKTLRTKLVAHMRETEEWGEFFPIEHSPFAYNETIAFPVYPFSKEDVLAHGWKWMERESDLGNINIRDAASVPERIEDVADDLVDEGIACEVSGKPFRIVTAELEFYRKNGIPVPRRHPDQRHIDRYALRTPYHLWARSCESCGTDIKTSYAPNSDRIIYCEACYENIVA